jgi:hypothetical protein
MMEKVKIRTIGPGIFFYSPFAASEIKEGEDYLASGFENPKMVEDQAVLGRLVGISLGTPGDFIIEIYNGYPEEGHLTNSPYKLRAGIEVRDRKICVRDIFDLMSWTASVPNERIIELDNGFYHMTFLGDEPEFGIFGDEQVIELYLNKLEEMPKLKFNGVPTLF